MQEELDREVEAASLGTLMDRLEAEILEVLWEELRPFEVSLADAERTLDLDPEHLSTRDRTVIGDALCRCHHLAGAVARKLGLSAPRKAPGKARAPGRPKVTVAPGTPRPTPLPPATQAQGVSPGSWLNTPHRPRMMTPMTHAEVGKEMERAKENPPRPVPLVVLREVLKAAPKADIVVYTDGSGTTSPKPCACGVVIYAEGLFYGRGFAIGEGTNNIGELSGIRMALLLLRDYREHPIEIRSDSEYALGACLNNRAHANAELIADIRLELRDFANITLRHVPGHAGLPGNELADRLAHQAIKTGTDVETHP